MKVSDSSGVEVKMSLSTFERTVEQAENRGQVALVDLLTLISTSKIPVGSIQINDMSSDTFAKAKRLGELITRGVLYEIRENGRKECVDGQGESDPALPNLL